MALAGSFDAPRYACQLFLRNAETYWFAQNIRAKGAIIAHQKTQYLGNEAHFLDWIQNQRMKLRQNVLAYFAQKSGATPYFGMLIALLIGDQQFITQKQWQVLQHTGTNHLMAISGLHIGIAAALGWLTGKWFWRLLVCCRLLAFFPCLIFQRWGSVLSATSYALLAGFNLPAQRALMMCVMWVVAASMDRRLSFWTIWCAVLFLIVLWDPWSVVYPGFWLSFLAVAR